MNVNGQKVTPAHLIVLVPDDPDVKSAVSAAVTPLDLSLSGRFKLLTSSPTEGGVIRRYRLASSVGGPSHEAIMADYRNGRKAKEES